MVIRVVSVFSLSIAILWHQGAASLTDIISPTKPLKDGQILTSGDGNNFVLGFFTPGNTTTQLRYVGVWYNKVATQTVVWVANRDRPINGSNGILSLTDDGNLVLSSHNSTLWSTAISYEGKRSQGPPKAQLLDSGNLVILVQDGLIEWQSFDHLTHILLPGPKMGLDRKTGYRRFLSSWRSKDDPGVGSYSFGVDDPKGGTPEFFMYKEERVRLWRSGPYVGERWSGLPEMTLNFVLNHTVIESPEEVYFRYNIRNDSVIAHFVLDGESATFKGETWRQSANQWIKFFEVPQDVCDNYAQCGDFGLCNSNTDKFKCSCFESYEPKSARDWYLRDASDGCVRVGNVSMCRNGEGFFKLANVKVPDTSMAKANMSMGLEDCREECLNNCSCLAYTSGTDGGDSHGPTNGCFVFYGALVDTRLFSPGGQDLYLRVDALDLARRLDESRGRLNKKRLVILLVCILLAFAFLAFFAICFYRKNKREWIEQEERSLWLGETGESDSTKTNSPIFRFSTIVDATKNFEVLLGEGGFGRVYKGKLSNGQEIAVKRLSKNSGQGIEEFKNEVKLISKLQHRNLVKTIGCCVRGEEKMLVYEFLPNKSLDKFIFDEEKKLVLSCKKRYEIITGIARGVLYLHQDSSLKIIHRDLKASNILLDDEMNPKISDFGLARIFGNDQREANTNRVVGTYGYMSPEYAMEGLFSIKSDVFSFGVILLEIITGQRSSRYHNDQISTNLSGYVWTLWQDQNVIEVVDKSILSTICGCEDDILRCVQIGLLCVQENPNERPTMLEVIFMLSNMADVPSPQEPAFFYKGNHRNEGNPHSSSTEIHSVNELTKTIVCAR